MDITLFLILVSVGFALYFAYNIVFTNGAIKACEDILREVEVDLKLHEMRSPKNYTRK